MSDKINLALARMQRVRTEGGNAMWPMIMADTLLTILEKSDTVSRAELRQKLVERAENPNAEKLIRDGASAAIEMLDLPNWTAD